MNSLAKKNRIVILHYSVPPVIGGVESVIEAHATQFVEAEIPVKIIAGRGDQTALPQGVEFVRIPEMDSQHPDILAATGLLNQGIVPENFKSLTENLVNKLRPELTNCDHLIVHNILTKHFNLPLTAALVQLMEEGVFSHTIAWCHDLTWTSPHSRKNVYPEPPWTLLNQIVKNTTYVAISEKRQKEIAYSFGCDIVSIPIIHSGVDPQSLLALSNEAMELVNRLGLWASDLILLMPVRITEAKNIELAMRVIKELKTIKRTPKLVVSGPPDPHDSANMLYYQSLLSLKHELGLDDNVHFVFESGPDPVKDYFIDSSVVSGLFRVADAMFMPSHREGFGMPILEAGMIGIPIISTAVPAVQDMQLKDALIFEKEIDPSQLSKRIVEWMDRKPEHQFRVEVRQNKTWKAIFDKQILPLLTGQTSRES